MTISQKDVEELRKLASSEHTPLEFCSLAKKLLLLDFDQAFDFLKKQKLIIKSRSQTAVRTIANDLFQWTRSAPVSGKRRATLRRHVEVSARMQELYSAIDEGANDLRIWECGRREAVLAVLDLVEQVYDACINEAHTRRWEGLDAWQVLDSSRSLTNALRNHCDVTLIILTQIALRCPEDGIRVDHPEDLVRPIELARLYDQLTVVFDHYTYTRWRVSVDGPDTRFHPAFDEYDKARQWCAQRTEASHHQFRDVVSMEYNRVERSAKKRASTERPSDRFPEFIESDLGRTIRTEIRPMTRLLFGFMSERVSRVFKLEERMQTKSGTFTIEELLRGWSGIWLLSMCARAWNAVRTRDGEFQGGDFGRVPVLSFGFLEDFLRSESGLTDTIARSFSMQFTADLNDRSSLDLFYRPLLRLSGNECALAISFAETSRFDRNVFRIALRDSDMDVSERGLKPVTDLIAVFKKRDFKAASNIPLSVQGIVSTDADLVVYRDGLLFVAQVKIVIEADSIYETWQVEQKLRTAASQLTRTLTLLKDNENLHQVVTDLAIPSSSAIKEVVPFILTNDWHFTGLRIGNFSVIDLSYLDLVLTNATVTAGTRERRIGLKFIRGETPTAEELKTLIIEPIHRGMFTRPFVRFHKQSIGNLSFSIPVTDVAGAEDSN